MTLLDSNQSHDLLNSTPLLLGTICLKVSPNQIGCKSQSQMPHVCNIYLQTLVILVVNAGQYSIHWWFGTFFLFFHILGMSSSQLTFTPSFFRGVGLKPPTRYGNVCFSLKPWIDWVPCLFEAHPTGDGPALRYVPPCGDLWRPSGPRGSLWIHVGLTKWRNILLYPLVY